MNTKGQGYSLTLVQVTQIQYFQTSFPQKTARPIKAKFHVALSWHVGMEVRSNGLDHMTKMAAMPLDGKNLLKSSSSEPKG